MNQPETLVAIGISFVDLEKYPESPNGLDRPLPWLQYWTHSSDWLTNPYFLIDAFLLYLHSKTPAACEGTGATARHPNLSLRAPWGRRSCGSKCFWDQKCSTVVGRSPMKVCIHSFTNTEMFIQIYKRRYSIYHLLLLRNSLGSASTEI